MRTHTSNFVQIVLVLTFALTAPVYAQTPEAGSIANGAMTPEQYAKGTTIADPRSPIASRPGAMTLAQVISTARAKNPTLLAAEQNLRAVRAQEIQAGVRVNPNFTLAASNITEPAAVNNPYTYAFQVSRLFERGEKRRWRLDDARATTAQTAAQ